MKQSKINNYDKLWYNGTPVKYKDYITNKFNDIHKQLYNSALKSFIDYAINNEEQFYCFNNDKELFKKYTKIIENKNIEYWMPSSIIVRVLYKDNRSVKEYDLTPFWNNFQNKNNEPNIDDLTIIGEKILDPEILSINYVSGKAKIESRMNDIEFDIDLNMVNSSSKYSNKFFKEL